MYQAITFLIQCKDVVWCCISIYASPILNIRIRLWDYPSQLRNIVHMPWLLAGDLKGVLFSSEVFGGNLHPTQFCHLAQAMTNCNLLDLHTI